jgi:hypothetical protein
MRTALKLVGIAPILLILGACASPESTSQPVAQSDAAESDVMLALTDGRWQGRIGGRPATLVVDDSEPVAYESLGYVAQSVSREGDVVRIDDAKLTLTGASVNTFSANWELGSTSITGAVFNLR